MVTVLWGSLSNVSFSSVGPPVVGENYREIASALRQIGDELDGDHQLQE